MTLSHKLKRFFQIFNTGLGPPQSLTATAISESTIIVNWKKPDGADADDIEFYKVTYGTNNSQSSTSDSFNQNVTLRSLISNSRYYIIVAAVYGSDEVGEAATIEETTRE